MVAFSCLFFLKPGESQTSQILSFNLIGTGGSGRLTNGTNGNIVGLDDITTVLVPNLVVNGNTLILAGDPNAPGDQQPVLTHALVKGSQAINADNNTLAVDGKGTLLTTDQQGLNRFVNTVDIGSFEVQ